MGIRNFRQLLEKNWSQGKFVCVGLDTDIARMPKHCLGKNRSHDVARFNEKIIQATADLACAYKINPAFYQGYRSGGHEAVSMTISKVLYGLVPQVPIIFDAKYADTKDTNGASARFVFDELHADAVTVMSYAGGEALQPFLDWKNKGIIVVCHTSNTGAGEFQDMSVDGVPLYEHVARHVIRWNKNWNCSLVAGALYPRQIRRIRDIVGDHGLPLLVPGIGAQGGDLEQTVCAAKDWRGKGFVINASRSVIFASDGEDFAEVARREVERLNTLINHYRTIEIGQ